MVFKGSYGESVFIIRRHCKPDISIDRCRQNETPVVICVFTNQVDTAWCGSQLIFFSEILLKLPVDIGFHNSKLNAPNVIQYYTGKG